MTAFRRWLIFRRYTTAYDGIAYDGSDGIITTGMVRIYDGILKLCDGELHDGSDGIIVTGVTGV